MNDNDLEMLQQLADKYTNGDLKKLVRKILYEAKVKKVFGEV